MIGLLTGGVFVVLALLFVVALLCLIATLVRSVWQDGGEW